MLYHQQTIIFVPMITDGDQRTNFQSQTVLVLIVNTCTVIVEQVIHLQDQPLNIESLNTVVKNNDVPLPNNTAVRNHVAPF